MQHFRALFIALLRFLWSFRLGSVKDSLKIGLLSLRGTWRNAWDEAVGLEGGHEDVEDPEEEEEGAGQDLRKSGTSEFASNLGMTTQQHHKYGTERLDAEESYSKGQAARKTVNIKINQMVLGNSRYKMVKIQRKLNQRYINWRLY